MSGGISSVTGVAAFNARKNGRVCCVLHFPSGFGASDHMWGGSTRETVDSSFQFLLKKRKTYVVSALFAAWKIGIFWRSVQDLRTKPWPLFLKSIVCSEIFPNESDHAQGRTGSCLLSHHSVVVWWIVIPAAEATRCFCFKAEFSGLSKPCIQLEKEHVSLWPTIEC